ncbi:MAG: hypothetical protein L0Y66_06395 [Myxococcaceae bacterium]|nr:hypothetical protein [Myxococcaceae bacterium]
MTPLLLLLALAHAPCTPPSPAAGVVDARGAAAYVNAGEMEMAAGAVRAAAFAYGAALRLDASNLRAREGLARACARLREDDAVEAASAHLDAARPREALASLKEVTEDSARADDAALLRALALMELGEDTAAHTALAPATRSPGAAGTARLLEAVLAFRADRAGEAEALLVGVREGRARTSAEALLPLLRRDERLRLSAAVRAGWDGNLARVPEGADESGADGATALEASVSWTPTGARGPLLGANALLSRQLTQHAFDAMVVDAHGGWRLGWGEALAGASYSQLGGSPYLMALRLDVAARREVGGLLLQAEYGVRRELFLRELAPVLSSQDSGFSGWRHVGGAGVAWWRAPLLLRAGWRLEADRADAAFYSFVEHGPEAGLTLLTESGVAVGLELRAAARRFLDVDPSFGTLRADGVLGATLTASLPMGAHWSWLASLQGTRVVSTLPAFTHGRVAAALGLRYTLGVP